MFVTIYTYTQDFWSKYFTLMFILCNILIDYIMFIIIIIGKMSCALLYTIINECINSNIQL